MVKNSTWTVTQWRLTGYGGQMLWIIPVLDLVVLVLHHNPKDWKGGHSISWEELENVIISSVLSGG